MRVHLWAILMLVGCGNATEERAKLAELEKKAEQRVAQAEKVGREKVDSLQKELDQIKAELAASKSKLEEATKAQASSEDAAKQLEAALLKARQAYKAEGKAKLLAVNKEVGEASAKASKANAKVKAQVQKLLKGIPAQQKAVAKDLADFDNATLETLDTIKAKLAKDLAALKASAHAIQARLPKS
jgi:chromosome segregation ATPase